MRQLPGSRVVLHPGRPSGRGPTGAATRGRPASLIATAALAALGALGAPGALGGCAPRAGAAAPPAPPPAVRVQEAEPGLLPGQNCVRVAPYHWMLDLRARAAELPAGDLRVRLPAGWQVHQERPGQVVLLAPAAPDGTRGVFELLVSPHCDRYDSSVMHQRVAVRALAPRFTAEAVSRAFRAKRHWKAQLGGVGTSIVLVDDLEIGDARVPLALYYTPVGSSETHEVTFAAACPRTPAGGACEATYRALFASVGSIGAATPRAARR
jgi:hypothetical protein